ncbi:TolC family outer membrane protein [Novosphingobium huizhouense]|uniref:TolC family outer membrane protein n=1 Tax=Novosphingobium huizhouense TaxID=2866625 RepID=UPI001CD8F206|nr:TolC family outer membrane protein [Novosphingobium huizhouense]
MNARTLRVGLLVASVSALTAPAFADDLRGALVAAYQTNPSLQAARANQRATDESVPIARASGLPSLAATASYTEFVKQTSNSFLAPSRQTSNDLSLSVPVFAGGAIKNSVRAAKTRVLAGQADLQGVESGVFAQTVAAYMDVIRDQAIVGLNRSNVQVLEVNLKATTDRYEIGDVTRTDVAQSNSRLALARGDLRTAEANLVASRERYVQVVGKAPVDLQPPPPLAGLPASPDDAVDIALANNPDLLAARQRSKAAGYDVKVAGAGRLPRVSVFTGGNYTNYLGTLGSVGSAGATQGQTTAQAGVQASIPLFQGGLPAARERQAQAVEGATMEQEISTEREVIATVRSAFTSWKAANDIIAMNQTAVEAAALSLEGVRAENTVGNRTILNILDAEQELLRAQVQLVAARRNAYVAGFNLLAAMGKAQAKDLALDAGPESAVLYDPQVNYDRVKGKIWDWASDPAPKPVATRTVDSPAQDATIPAQPAP